jgi:uncharacterized membrane protein
MSNLDFKNYLIKRLDNMGYECLENSYTVRYTKQVGEIQVDVEFAGESYIYLKIIKINSGKILCDLRFANGEINMEFITSILNKYEGA